MKNYDTTQLRQTGIQNLNSINSKSEPMLKKLIEDRIAQKEVLQNVDLNNEEVKQLLSFLETLTDPCVKDKACLQKWIPTRNEDPNGNQLDAIDNNGSAI